MFLTETNVFFFKFSEPGVGVGGGGRRLRFSATVLVSYITIIPDTAQKIFI